MLPPCAALLYSTAVLKALAAYVSASVPKRMEVVEVVEVIRMGEWHGSSHSTSSIAALLTPRWRWWQWSCRGGWGGETVVEPSCQSL